MELKTLFATDNHGNVTPGALAYLYQAGTTTPVAGLLDVNGDPLANPFTAGADGLLQFRAAPGEYDLRITYKQLDRKIRVQFLDSADVDADAAGSADAAAEFARQRANHTGTQDVSTVNGLPERLAALEQFDMDLANATDPEKGAGMVGWSGGSVADRLGSELFPSDFSAIPDGITDLSAQLIEFARSANRPAFVYTGEITLRVPDDFATVNAALASLKYKRLPHDVKFTIKVSGKVICAEPIVVDTNINNVDIVGDTPEILGITSMVSVAGSSGAYDVTLSLSSVTNVAVGDYLVVRGDSTLIGNALAGEHWGCWKVTAVDSGAGTATVRNTARFSGMTTSPTTGATATLIKTVLKFANTDGLCIGPEGNIGTINNLVLEGGGVGSSADYGLVVGYRSGVKPAGATSNIRTSSASARIDENVGVVNWDRSGVWVGYGSSLYCEGRMASCSNGEAGFEADTGGFITTGWYKQQPVANGNGGHGFLAYNCAGIWAGSFLIACGNGGYGVASLMGSAIVTGSAGCIANRNSYGLGADDSSAIDGQKQQANYNANAGIRSARGSSVVATQASCSNNGTYGLYSAIGSSLAATSATLTNNVSHGAYCLNSNIDASLATSSGNGGHGYLADGGVVRAVSAFAHSNGPSDYGCTNNGYLDATSTKGVDGVTGARYFANNHGFIDALSSVASGATYNPTYNTNTSRGAFILLKDIPQKFARSVRSQVLSTGTVSYTPDMDLAHHHKIEFSGAASFNFNNPTNSNGTATELILQVKNTNVSTAITPTFSGGYVVPTLASISVGSSSVYTFITSDSAKWVMTGKIENVVI